MKDREKAIFVAAILFGFTSVSPAQAGPINAISSWDRCRRQLAR